MRYVPAQSAEPAASSPTPTASAAAVRSAVRELRTEAERRAWAGRGPFRNSTRSPLSAQLDLPPDVGDAGESDRLGGLLTELRAVTTRYVCALRAEGARPEQMLVRVKAFVRDAMAAEGWQDPAAVQALTAEVVSWSIAAYYDR